MTNPALAAAATTESKQALRLIAAHLRGTNDCEANRLRRLRVDEALAPLNAAVEAHEPITADMVRNALVALAADPLFANHNANPTEPSFGSLAEALMLPEVASLVSDVPLFDLPCQDREVPAQIPAQAPAQADQHRSGPRPHFDEIPQGRYAYTTEDGHVAFAEVVHRDYRSGTYAFANLLTGAPGKWRSRRMGTGAQVAVLGKIKALGVEESARMFGQKSESCGFCGSPLSNICSRASGYGEVCARNHGLWYASEAEARLMLGEAG